MAKKSKSPSQHEAPDPARSYERAKPEAEAGMGSLDSVEPRRSDQPDRQHEAVRNRQQPRQINTEDATDQRAKPKQPDHSMNEEEPMGWDQAPKEPTAPRNKRHPRKEGKGGMQ